jgi:Immunity protein 50
MPELIAPSVPGAEEVVRWFGEWPSFHDAEVLEVSLRRKGRSSIRVHAWRMTNEVNADGYFVLDRHAVVTIWLEGITDLELGDFSVQNVIANLEVRPHEAGFRVTLWPIYGVGGHIDAARVTLSLEPGKPGEAANDTEA